MRPETSPTHDSVKRISRAAQYLRMSTEHQKYSTRNQAEAIATYAGLHNLRSYVLTRTWAAVGSAWTVDLISKGSSTI